MSRMVAEAHELELTVTGSCSCSRIYYDLKSPNSARASDTVAVRPRPQARSFLTVAA
jgi:hypothetical protein